MGRGHLEEIRNFLMLNKSLIAVLCLISFSCEHKETAPTTPHEEPIKKLIGVWSSPETAPYFKVLSLYSDNTFLIIRSSDVGGCNYHGTYREDEMNIVLSPMGYVASSESSPGFIPIDLSESEQFHFRKGEGKIQWLKSSSEDRFMLYLCDGLNDVSKWYEFIVNDKDFRNRVMQYPNRIRNNENRLRDTHRLRDTQKRVITEKEKGQEKGHQEKGQSVDCGFVRLIGVFGGW